MDRLILSGEFRWNHQVWIMHNFSIILLILLSCLVAWNYLVFPELFSISRFDIFSTFKLCVIYRRFSSERFLSPEFCVSTSKPTNHALVQEGRTPLSYAGTANEYGLRSCSSRTGQTSMRSITWGSSGVSQCVACRKEMCRIALGEMRSRTMRVWRCLISM